MQTFVDPNLLQRLRVGPLAVYLDAYLKQIAEEGFSPCSAPIHLYAIARFSKWLLARHFDLHQVNEAAVVQFLERDPGVLHGGERATLRRLLAMLRQIGVTEAQPVQPKNAQQRFLDEYRRYLLQQRGLAETTVPSYIEFAEQLLSDHFGQENPNFAELRAPDVTRFIQSRARYGSERNKLLVTSVRSFLRYLRYQGAITVDLAGCVPAVAAWSLSTVPKGLPAGTVQRVLDDCERKSSHGRRNYAVLLLLARLGLRSCEVVALNLDDIDWENGRITIRGKGGRWAQMPLPADVGEAIALYVQSGRPCCTSRRVFVRHRAPMRGLAKRGSVYSIVQRALLRAGVRSGRKGPHVFRHTLATDLLRQGASLDEIGELLRHQSPDTTAIYAKVDMVALRTLALSWPGGAQ
jgi:site-specific recombinase XerD